MGEKKEVESFEGEMHIGGIYTQAEEKFNSLVRNRMKEMRGKTTDHVMLKRK